MSNALANFSNIIIPAILFYIVGYGIIHHRNVYEDFIKGAEEGFRSVIRIMPTLIGLMTAVGVLRASGFLDLLGRGIGWFTEPIGLPAPVVPVILVKLFSSSAATGLVLDLFKTYGTDSRIGMMVSLLLSCTETCFYTMSVYYMAARVTKTRYTLSGALLATAAGIAASIVLTNYLVPYSQANF